VAAVPVKVGPHDNRHVIATRDAPLSIPAESPATRRKGRCRRALPIFPDIVPVGGVNLQASCGFTGDAESGRDTEVGFPFGRTFQKALLGGGGESAYGKKTRSY
jgi:hypothetical protein